MPVLTAEDVYPIECKIRDASTSLGLLTNLAASCPPDWATERIEYLHHAAILLNQAAAYVKGAAFGRTPYPMLEDDLIQSAVRSRMRQVNGPRTIPQAKIIERVRKGIRAAKKK